MKLLLDTHVLLWALSEPARLVDRVAAAIIDPENEVVVSAASAWEMAIKQSTGKLDLPGPAADWLPPEVARAGFDWIPVAPEEALAVGVLPQHHRDPFDRLLVAQASRGYVLVTHDEKLRAYGVPILWA